MSVYSYAVNAIRWRLFYEGNTGYPSICVYSSIFYMGVCRQQTGGRMDNFFCNYLYKHNKFCNEKADFFL